MPSAVENLRKLSRRDSTHEHHLAYTEQLTPDTNHRGAALILAANVETAMDAAIERYLRLDETSRLLQDDNFFASFYRKIELGRALEIYHDQTYANLNTMRHVRNAFAHAKIPLTFDTAEVAAVCDQFTIMEVISPKIVREKPDKSKLTPRQLYEEIGNELAHNLIWWSLEPTQEIDVAAFTLGQDPQYPLYYRRKGPLP